jgi:hypothetical protein
MAYILCFGITGFLLRTVKSTSSIAILIIKIDFLEAHLWWASKKSILVFSAPLALETPKLIS